MSKRYSMILLGLLVSLFGEPLMTALPGLAATDVAVPLTAVAPGIGTDTSKGPSKIDEIIDMGSIRRDRPVGQKQIKFTLPAGASSFTIAAPEPFHFGLSSTGGYLTAIPPNREVSVTVFPRPTQAGTFSQLIAVKAGNRILKLVLLKVTVLPPVPSPGNPGSGDR